MKKYLWANEIYNVCTPHYMALNSFFQDDGYGNMVNVVGEKLEHYDKCSEEFEHFTQQNH